jgi:hypothetical protein
MKTIVLPFLLLTFFTACDAPQRTRALTNSYGSGIQYNGTEGSSTTGSLGGTTSSATNGSNTTSGTNNGTTLPSDFSGCNTTPSFYAAGIGQTSVCQSSVNETSVRVMFTQADQDSGTCLIPTYKDAAGSSMYLGQPQCTLHAANQVIYGSLPKTRVGFSSYPVKGVMVMKRSALTAYFTCMDAYVNFVATYCPTGVTAACQRDGQAYMTNMCNEFKTMHSYMDIRLKN